MSSSERVGFIGLGEQGRPIARRLAARFPLTVWSRRDVPFDDAVVAATPEILGADCALVGICVSVDGDVCEVASRVGSAMAPGGLLIVHSTVAPETIRKLEAQLALQRVALLDAPVTGGPSRAEAGELTVMVGGTTDALTRAQAYLDCFASHVEYLGGAGTGQMMKLVNNGLFFANAATAASALRLARELGLAPAAAARVLRSGTARSEAMNLLGMDECGTVQPLRMQAITKDLGHFSALAAGARRGANLVAETASRLVDYIGNGQRGG